MLFLVSLSFLSRLSLSLSLSLISLSRLSLSLLEAWRAKTNKQKQLFGFVPRTGGGQNGLRAAFFFGEKEEHAGTTDNPGIIRGESHESFVDPPPK